MNDFLKKYVLRFSHKSITTKDFQDFFTEFFADKVLRTNLLRAVCLMAFVPMSPCMQTCVRVRACVRCACMHVWLTP